jgi:receptor expression-enhancing protein 5/6
MAYYSVLRPVLANVGHRTGPSRSFSNDTVTAEGLRDRVATATTE